MKIQKLVQVNLCKKRTVSDIHLVQYDTGVQLVLDIVDFQIPDGTTATLYVQKPSGKFVYQEDGITVTESKVTIDLKNQAITEHGNIPYQLRVKNGEDLITTFTGIMKVDRSLADSGAVESKTVAAAFDEKLAEILAATISATDDGAGNVTLVIR
jgi:hypothetical protein